MTTRCVAGQFLWAIGATYQPHICTSHKKGKGRTGRTARLDGTGRDRDSTTPVASCTLRDPSHQRLPPSFLLDVLSWPSLPARSHIYLHLSFLCLTPISHVPCVIPCFPTPSLLSVCPLFLHQTLRGKPAVPRVLPSRIPHPVVLLVLSIARPSAVVPSHPTMRVQRTSSVRRGLLKFHDHWWSDSLPILPLYETVPPRHPAPNERVPRSDTPPLFVQTYPYGFHPADLWGRQLLTHEDNNSTQHQEADQFVSHDDRNPS